MGFSGRPVVSHRKPLSSWCWTGPLYKHVTQWRKNCSLRIKWSFYGPYFQLITNKNRITHNILYFCYEIHLTHCTFKSNFKRNSNQQPGRFYLLQCTVRMDPNELKSHWKCWIILPVSESQCSQTCSGCLCLSPLQEILICQTSQVFCLAPQMQNRASQRTLPLFHSVNLGVAP